jgi:Zn-dependent membrane protease YugP
MQLLRSSGAMTGEELEGARKVLNAAAMTYVAAALASVLTLLRLVLLSRR